jgi:hypothetical protein
MSRDGSAGRGDYISVESIPVPRGSGSVDVRVERLTA